MLEQLIKILEENKLQPLNVTFTPVPGKKKPVVITGGSYDSYHKKGNFMVYLDIARPIEEDEEEEKEVKEGEEPIEKIPLNLYGAVLQRVQNTIVVTMSDAKLIIDGLTTINT